jgi:(1->4)-alpha-D-glucan 1-alpha-D-glucosylmutase
MAKGVEDTALYRYVRLLALNEVGGDPQRFGLSLGDFHLANVRRAERFPRALLAAQTHDTKRSGDVRARIGVLARLGGEWAKLIEDWHHGARTLRRGPGPDRAEEYLIYQTLIGTWPISAERLAGYLRKALREAGRNSNWSHPDTVWEQSVIDFASSLATHAPFRATFDPFVERVALAGERDALGALLLRMTCPGVPDIYQGDERWSLNLVDPDNRRPVDWEERRSALAALVRGAPVDRATSKMALIHATLGLRARHAHAFEGSYVPLEAPSGVCAFTRGDEVAVIVGVGDGGDIASVAPPGSGWRDVLTDPLWPTSVRLLERTPR